MNSFNHPRAISLFALLLALATATLRVVASSPLISSDISLLSQPSDTIPRQEMRGAWLATVWGLDWPSSSGATVADANRQRAELVAILDKLQSIGINAVFFQVRSMADAMYRSEIEPWSRFLTGSRGVAPADKSWDPLLFCLEEAHARGMECHAWVNPFRVTNNVTLPSTPNDRRLQAEGWLITYRKTANRTTTSTTILDPGNSEVRAYIADICRDIVGRYDIDGLIFDDYFYPEGLPEGNGYDFEEYRRSGSSLTQAQWRRENVARTIREVSQAIRDVNPDIKFGISPAGVAGGNGTTASLHGLPRCYAGHDWMLDGIYCDPLQWLADGYIDYISPQIYWPHDHSTNPYEPIARWWSEVASHFNRHVYQSVSIDRIYSAKQFTPHAETALLIAHNRATHGTDAPGHIFYSTKKLITPESPLSANSAAHFPLPALTPEMSWRPSPDPGPVTGLSRSGNKISWTPNRARRYTVYAIPASDFALLSADQHSSGSPNTSRNDTSINGNVSPINGNVSPINGNVTSIDFDKLPMKYLVGISYLPEFTLPPSTPPDAIIAVAPFDRLSHEWPYTILLPTSPRQHSLSDSIDTAIQDIFSH